MEERAVDRMDERLSRIEVLVAELEGRLGLLERRGVDAGDHPERGQAARQPFRSGASVDADLVGVFSLVGRTLVVWAGAYLLRALTDAGALPAVAGVVGGMLYAAAWALAADRDAAAGRRLSATLHATAAVPIAFPLLWEAQLRFGLMSAAASATGLAVVSAAFLVMAWRRRLRAVAWMVTVAAVATNVGLLVRTGAVAPFTLHLIALGIGTLWLGYVRGWIGLRWPVAIAANLAVLGASARGLGPEPLEAISVVLALQVLLPTAYLSTIAARTLWLGRRVIPFEIVQGTAALAIGLGGALALTRATDVGHAAVGLAALALGSAGYVVAFAFVDRAQRGGANFYFYTSLGLALLITACGILLRPEAQTLALSAFGFAAAWASSRFSRATLATHAALALATAAAFGGVLVTNWQALFGAAGVLPAPPAPVGWVVVIAAGGALIYAHGHAAAAAAPLAARLPRLALAALLVSSAGGLTLAWLGATAHAVAPGALTPGSVATLRSVVLAALALALAALAKRPRSIELRWLVYPVLGAAGLKLLIEDFRWSPPSMLVVALAAYGLALIIAPRLVRREHAGSAAVADAAAVDRSQVV
jgi:hypothetical protein